MNKDNFGYNLLRNIVIPNILEDDTSEILYWSGRKLFTEVQSQITSTDELINFFENAQFGTLSIKKEAKTKYEFVLAGELVSERAKMEKPEFSLEIGFLTEYVENETNSYCLSDISIKSKQVIITIDIDHKSNIN